MTDTTEPAPPVDDEHDEHDEVDDDGEPASVAGRDIGLTRAEVEGDEDGWPWWGVLGVACVVALAIGVFLASVRSTDGSDDVASPNPSVGDGTVPAGHPSLDNSDQFEELTLAQLESEVADESAPVSLRLTLAERYLATGDLHEARAQARIAQAQAGTDVERQRALRDLGWAVALLGRPERGAELLDRALEIFPDERNATWYLANVRLSGLNDPEGAAELFRALLSESDLAAEQRAIIEDRLDTAEAVARGDTPTPTSIPAN